MFPRKKEAGNHQHVEPGGNHPPLHSPWYSLRQAVPDQPRSGTTWDKASRVQCPAPGSRAHPCTTRHQQQQLLSRRRSRRRARSAAKGRARIRQGTMAVCKAERALVAEACTRFVLGRRKRMDAAGPDPVNSRSECTPGISLSQSRRALATAAGRSFGPGSSWVALDLEASGPLIGGHRRMCCAHGNSSSL